MELTQWIRERLQDRLDVVSQRIEQDDFICTIYYMMDAIDLEMLQTHVLRKLLQPYPGRSDERLQSIFQSKTFFSAAYNVSHTPEEALEGLFNGYVLLCISGETTGVVFPFPQKAKREVNVSENEKTIRGPKESFVEDVSTNLSLIRQRIKSDNLVVEQFIIGSESRTIVLLLYMKGRCDVELVQQFKTKLGAIRTDRVPDSSFLEELLDERLISPFPKMLNTERPDVVVSSLFEGRLALLTDGTPSNLVAPATLLSFMQSAEDYYQRYFYSSWIRLLRYIFFAVSLVLPSAYVAITTFHPEMLPYNMLISLAASRDIVPFPAILEALIMEVTFEVMREAGQRIPTTMGQTISIVGAIVIGEAAVQAGIVSAPMVIIVALTGISSFVVPHFSLTLTVRFLRFALLFISAIFGLLGLLIGVFFIYIHLLSMESYGTPYLSPFIPFKSEQMRDAAGRFPWTKWMGKKRP
ncbi:spore germination protein [Paenibacillus qinlingensis]|uniref:Spore germination protein KA n=1 Tax=Paenibacillus qinlingensis TaxID=1837343 RepID=A0ABU1P3F5_9BACL|nr:spore germination protein [Paenibacillus qinlingensis]MDR6554292.1 spore germination protein KA [Paenibacillus qinlingensis]